MKLSIATDIAQPVIVPFDRHFFSSRRSYQSMAQGIRLCCGWTFDFDLRANEDAGDDRRSSNLPPPENSKRKKIIILLLTLGVLALLFSRLGSK
jgi:hypothetical protein